HRTGGAACAGTSAERFLLFTFGNFRITGGMETGLKGRGVIVAASSTGIGRATAEAFAREGAQVAMCARTASTLQQAAADIRNGYGVEVLAQALDVTNAAAVRNFVEQAAKQ